MATPYELEEWRARKERVIGLGERSFHKSYYPQLKMNLERLERFRTLLDRTTDFVLLVTLPEGDIIDANAAVGRLVGQPVDALIGTPVASLGVADAEMVLGVLRCDSVLRCEGGEMQTHTVLSPFSTGTCVYWLEITYRVARVDGRCYGVLVGRDVTERKEAEERARFLAQHDALTQLPNYLVLGDRVMQAAAFADRSGALLGLIVLDLDQFKAVNDSLGHSVGDKLLVEVSRRVNGCLRETDTLSRQGGDEFVILLTNLSDPDDCVTVLSGLMGRLLQPFEVHEMVMTLTASAGIAVYPGDGRDFETLHKNAEMAMYRAKAAGRNGYRFFNEQMNRDAIEHLEIRSGLTRALDERQFCLHYQPQVRIADGVLIGAEALIRWMHPDHGLVYPGRFIQVAEESGLIVAMGDWVLQEACAEAQRWALPAGGECLTVAVNLSAIQFQRGNIERSVIEALERSGLAPERLELELTESILIQNTETVLSTVKRLKQLGVRLSIDDFGTGYSSLSYLKRFEVDKLKIDQSFVRELSAGAEDAAIVRAIIQMAHSLGLKTLAEGVEGPETLALLRADGCDESQGYYHGRPIQPDQFIATLGRAIAG